jgi:hypothetical protein
MSIQSLGGTLSERPGALRQQCAGAVLMIRPAAFDYNPETALTNKLQRPMVRRIPRRAPARSSMASFGHSRVKVSPFAWWPILTSLRNLTLYSPTTG